MFSRARATFFSSRSTVVSVTPLARAASATTQLEKCALRRRHRQERKAAPDFHGNTAQRRLIACRLFLERAHHLFHVGGNVMKHLRLPRDSRTARCAD